MSNFFQSKGERDIKSEFGTAARVMPKQSDPGTGEISTLARGMQITGNIVCAGTLNVYGRVKGDIHALQLTICAGAVVEGKVVAQDAVVEGRFNGTVHGNNVKLSKTAVVDGEIFSKSLSIEQDAQFEGVSRKLDKGIDAPGASQLTTSQLAASQLAASPLNGDKPAPARQAAMPPPTAAVN